MKERTENQTNEAVKTEINKEEKDIVYTERNENHTNEKLYELQRFERKID